MMADHVCAAFGKHDCSMLEAPDFVKYILMAFPAPSGSPATGDITHLGPGKVSFAYSMVSHSQHPFFCLSRTVTELALAQSLEWHLRTEPRARCCHLRLG